MSQFPSSPFMRALAAGIQANVPVMIWGNPGQSKTATLENAARAWGRHPETLVGSNREATDFLGVMIENNGVVNYSSFGWVNRLNAAPKGLLFLDEFNTAGPSTMKAMLRVVEERVVGEQKLNDSVAIVAAANPISTAVDAYDLPAPMANRMMHLDWVFNTELWMNNVCTGFANVSYDDLDRITAADPVARRARVVGEITSFLNMRPNALAPNPPKNPSDAGKAWASPRTWTKAIEVLSHVEQGDVEATMLVVKGLVGEAMATEYVAWLATADLHDPMEVINNPSIVDWKNERPDRLFALTQSVALLGLADAKVWPKATLVLAACAAGGKPDAALPAATALLNKIPAKAAIPAVVRSSFADLFERTTYSVSNAA